jgi:pilus assembly protein Flp/PilA
LPSNHQELSGIEPKELTVNANILSRCKVKPGLPSPSRRARAIEKASAFLGDDGGATMVEYAFMVMLIAIVCVATISSVGSKLNTVYNTVANDF